MTSTTIQWPGGSASAGDDEPLSCVPRSTQRLSAVSGVMCRCCRDASLVVRVLQCHCSRSAAGPVLCLSQHGSISQSNAQAWMAKVLAQAEVASTSNRCMTSKSNLWFGGSASSGDARTLSRVVCLFHVVLCSLAVLLGCVTGGPYAAAPLQPQFGLLCVILLTDGSISSPLLYSEPWAAKVLYKQGWHAPLFLYGKHHGPLAWEAQQGSTGNQQGIVTLCLTRAVCTHGHHVVVYVHGVLCW